MINAAEVAENLYPIGYKPTSEAQAREPRPVMIRRDGVVKNLGKISPTPSVEGYLYQLALLCLEVIRRPSLLPVFLGVLRLAPSTIEALRAERKLAA